MPGNKKAPCIDRWALVRLSNRETNPGRRLCGDVGILAPPLGACQRKTRNAATTAAKKRGESTARAASKT
jgi:hypothetical protein